MNKQEQEEMDKFIHKFKENFSGSDDYLSGINEAAYSMYRIIKKETVEPLEKELKVTEDILEDRERIFAVIPECNLHGEICTPHAIKWIEKVKRKVVDLPEIKVSPSKPIFIIEIPSNVAEIIKDIKKHFKELESLKEDYHVLVFISDVDNLKFTVMGEGEFSSSSLSKRVDELLGKKGEEKEYACDVCFDKGVFTSLVGREGIRTEVKCRCKKEKV